ncbi:unnamed protein product [Auanema sp. JU1783]|nr:unnamed protein product [Auanema sp. JU1783]
MATIEHKVHVFWEEDQLVPSCSSAPSDSRGGQDRDRSKSIKKTKSWNSNLLAVREKRRYKSYSGKRRKYVVAKSRYLQTLKFRQLKAKINEQNEQKKLEKLRRKEVITLSSVQDRVKELEQSAREMRREVDKQTQEFMMFFVSLIG